MKYLQILIVLMTASCASTRQSIDGLYTKKGPDYEYRLTLNEDNTFVLTLRYQDASPECKGTWEYLNRRGEIEINCDDIDNITETLSNKHMVERTRIVEIISKNELMVDGVILKKIN